MTRDIMDTYNWGPIGREVYERTYSRAKPDGKKENWLETVTRTVDGNLALVPKKFHWKNERDQLISSMLQFKLLPAGRHLWVSGVPGRQFLFNCVSAETKVHTDKGIFEIKELVGQSVNVLSKNGQYRPAEIKVFGKQKLYRIEFADGTVEFATANHRWEVNKRKNPVITENLVGHDIPYVSAPKPSSDCLLFTRGVMHGYVFGDGSRQGMNKVQLQMFGATSSTMSEIFSDNGFNVTNPDYCDAYVGKLPREWKELPCQNEPLEYLYGFMAGLIAADGYVDKKGSVFIYQASREVLEFISKISYRVGLLATNIRLQREKSPFDGSDKPLYVIGFRRLSFDPTILINPIHIKNWNGAPTPYNKAVRVTSVVETDRIEEVYCAVEPETETFVIGNGKLTKNCHTAGWTDNLAEHYTFTFDELMKGGGVGANYSNKYIKKYGAVKNKTSIHFVCNPDHPDYAKFASKLSDEFHYTWAGCSRIEDSREGWVKALNAVITQAIFGQNFALIFDVSNIRPYGAPIRGFGGTASGPYSLIDMLDKIASLLNSRVGEKLASLDHMLMDHYIAECVVAGNVRRSARMAMKHWKDEDIFSFIHCKEDAARLAHFTTNISVEIDNAFFRAYHRGDEWAKKVYKECIDGLSASGEPGFWNSSLSQVGEVDEVYCTNPCGEISMMPWENCNLGHVNLDAFYNDAEGAKNAFRLMARFLIRATFGDISNSLQREVVSRNRRIGVGFFGYQGWVCKQGIRYSESHRDYGIRATLHSFFQEIKKEAQEYSHLLRIPCPIKNTTIAPTGTIAKLPGKGEGAQSLFAKYFIRNVRFANNDPKLIEFKAKGFDMEPCVYTPDTTVVSLWCKVRLVDEMEMLGMDPSIVEGQEDVDIEDALALQAMLQREFVDNSISFTVNLPDKGIAKKKLYHTIIRFLPELKGTTVIRGAGDRPQPPYTAISKEQFDNYTGPRMTSQGEMECKGNICPIK